MITSIIIAVITVFVYVSLVARISNKMLLLFAGHSFTVDLLFTSMISIMAGITGSLGGLMISAFTGLFISLFLFFIKFYYGSARISRKLNSETGKKTWKFGISVYKPTKKVPSFLKALLNKLGAVQQEERATVYA